MQVEAVTQTASRLARQYGHAYYVLQRRSATGDGRRGRLPVVFWWDAPSLPRILQADAGAGELTILRVAHPDGRVEPVDDPGDYARRLAAFGPPAAPRPAGVAP